MKENFRKILAALLALVLAVSLCACADPTPAEPSSPESGSPSSQPETSSSQPEPEPEPRPGSQVTEDDGSEADGDAADTTDAGGDFEPEVGQPQVWTVAFDDLSDWDKMRIWSEEEIDRLLTGIAGQLYLEDEALTGLTPVYRQGGPAEYSYGILVSDTAIGYFAYQNDAGKDVAFRIITCSVTWVESEKKYLLDLISFEEWEQE